MMIICSYLLFEYLNKNRDREEKEQTIQNRIYLMIYNNNNN